MERGDLDYGMAFLASHCAGDYCLTRDRMPLHALPL
jgi:hypothetical protein